MNLSYKPKERRVVPNWRYYESTLAAGELNSWQSIPNEGESYSIDDYISLWNDHHSLFRAGDLISAAITNGNQVVSAVKDAASFILEKENESTKTLVNSARKILGIDSSLQSQSDTEIARLRECTALEDIRSTIHNIRQRIQLMPYNPFLYVDLSRAYLLMGQVKKAEFAIEQALHYGATNRFVARSAARFYLHIKDKDRAYDAIRAKGAVSVDPWLMAAEISINMLRDKTSNYIRKGKEIIESGHCNPFGFTELASSIGTLELSAGAVRKSHKLFKKALIMPNDNSLAQIQWVNSFESLSLNLNTSVHNDYEVKTFESLKNGDLNQAVHEAVNWICDMPFSHKPINIGYSICTNLLRDFSLASAIVDVGLQSDDTSPFLLNNKAYCCARANKIVDAQDAFEKLMKSNRLDSSTSWKVCITATEGLILYRSNHHEEGSQKYKEAIDIARNSADNSKDKSLYAKAVLNYCRERLIARDGDPDAILADASIAVNEIDNEELNLLYEEVKYEYKNIKNG